MQWWIIIEKEMEVEYERIKCVVKPIYPINSISESKTDDVDSLKKSLI